MQPVIAEKTEKDSPFTIVKDGNGYEYKVVNLENPDMCPRSGIIELEAISKNQLKQPNYSFRTVRDRVTGIIYGIPQGVDPKTREIKWKRIILGDFRRYDLKNYQDAQEWAIVRMAEFLEGSPLAKGKPKYRKFDKEQDAVDKIKFFETRDRADGIAKNLTGEALVDMARNVGIDPGLFSLTMLVAEVRDYANRHPNEFLSIWDNAHREILTIVKRAMSVGLITHSIADGYVYKGMSIGITEAMVISELSKKIQLTNNINIESKELDKAGKKHVKQDNATTGNVVDASVVDEMTKKIAELEKQLAEKERTKVDVEGKHAKEPSKVAKGKKAVAEEIDSPSFEE